MTSQVDGLTLKEKNHQKLVSDILERIKDIHGINPPEQMTFNSAMIQVSIPITKFGTLTNSRRWACLYTDSGYGFSGIHGTYIDKKLGSMFAFTATPTWINLIPKVHYNPMSLVDFLLWIRKIISKDAIIMPYNEYCEKHKDDEIR